MKPTFYPAFPKLGHFQQLDIVITDDTQLGR
jgi:hypothetical protein